VEVSNLQRQIAHFTKDINIPKVESAAEKMYAINPDITVKTYKDFLCADNINSIIAGYDFVIDGTDNFPTKFLVNDACVFKGIPFSHGGILRFNGQTMTVVPGESACYRCSFREAPPPDAVPSCAQAGVLGAIAGMLGTIQATEALKYITGVGELLTNGLLTFDARTLTFRKINLARQKSCPLCGEEPSITQLVDAEQSVCELKSEPVAAPC
jgi:adenylyltransferase/sulfurtransferase